MFEGRTLDEAAADTILGVRVGGPPEPSDRPKRRRDAYDDQLERELAALD